MYGRKPQLSDARSSDGIYTAYACFTENRLLKLDLTTKLPVCHTLAMHDALIALILCVFLKEATFPLPQLFSIKKNLCSTEYKTKDDMLVRTYSLPE